MFIILRIQTLRYTEVRGGAVADAGGFGVGRIIVHRASVVELKWAGPVVT